MNYFYKKLINFFKTTHTKKTENIKKLISIIKFIKLLKNEVI
jgi:hypothetical protein